MLRRGWRRFVHVILSDAAGVTIRILTIVMLAVIVGVVLFGTLKDRGQDDDTRQVACAVARFDAELLGYFGDARDRLIAREGTPDELSTDRSARASLDLLFGAFTALRDDLGGTCGPITTPPATGRTAR